MADVVILASGPVTSVSVDNSSTTFLAGDMLANDGSGNWVLADADVAARQDAQWVCLEGRSAGQGPNGAAAIAVAKWAIINDTDAPYTAGALQFLSATAGKHTETQPTAAVGTVQRCVGKAISTSTVYLNMGIPHYFVPHSIISTAAATAANYGRFFVAPRPLRAIEMREVHFVLGTDGSAVTLNLEKVPSGTAPDSGTAMLASTIDLKGTINTVVARTMTSAAAARMATGDTLCLLDTGTLTDVADVAVTVTLVDEQSI